MAEIFGYYDSGWQEKEFSCPDCGWSGRTGDMDPDWFRDLMDFSCPGCDKMLVIVCYSRPTRIKLKDATMVFLDVETTGLSPAMGDRVVEIGMIICQGQHEVDRLCVLVNPEREIPEDAQEIHGITDHDVIGSPTFSSLAAKISEKLEGVWLVGHNVAFDIGFVGMELMQAGILAKPAGCLDTRRLAEATWDLPNYKLGTVAGSLGVLSPRKHRAADDAETSRQILHRVVNELGGWDEVRIEDLQALHAWLPAWPDDPRRNLPASIYDSLTNGREIEISYVNGKQQASNRSIRPVACFAVGRHTYLKAHCSRAKELRIFRLDRIVLT